MTQEITIIISGVIIAIISGTFMAVMKRSWAKKADCNYNTRYDYGYLLSHVWRLNKTVLIMAKILDEQTAKEHPDLTTNLENIASELLNESDNS